LPATEIVLGSFSAAGVVTLVDIWQYTSVEHGNIIIIIPFEPTNNRSEMSRETTFFLSPPPLTGCDNEFFTRFKPSNGHGVRVLCTLIARRSFVLEIKRVGRFDWKKRPSASVTRITKTDTRCPDETRPNFRFVWRARARRFRFWRFRSFGVRPA